MTDVRRLLKAKGWSYDLLSETEWEYARRAGDERHATAPFQEEGWGPVIQT